MWMVARTTIASSPIRFLPIRATFRLACGLKASSSQRDVDLDKDAGLNLYVVLTANSNLSLFERNGMCAHSSSSRNGVLIRLPSTAPQSPVGSCIDEIDMAAGPNRGYTTLKNISNAASERWTHALQQLRQGRHVLGNGREAARFVNAQQVRRWTNIGSPIRFKELKGGKLLNGGSPLTPTRAANYGNTVDRVATLDATDDVIQADLEFRGGGLALL